MINLIQMPPLVKHWGHFLVLVCACVCEEIRPHRKAKLLETLTEEKSFQSSITWQVNCHLLSLPCCHCRGERQEGWGESGEWECKQVAMHWVKQRMPSRPQCDSPKGSGWQGVQPPRKRKTLGSWWAASSPGGNHSHWLVHSLESSMYLRPNTGPTSSRKGLFVPQQVNEEAWKLELRLQNRVFGGSGHSLYRSV